MKNFLKFILQSPRIFWLELLSFSIMINLIIGFFFDFPAKEILMESLVSFILLPALVWVLGGYEKIRANVYDKFNLND